MSISIIIILLTAATSIAAFPPHIPSIDAIRQPSWFKRYCFNAYAIYKFNQYERFITHGFIHADWFHLIFNMLTLYFFGKQIENLYKIFYNDYGNLIFILFYISGLVVSSIYDFFKHKSHSWYNAVGASGAVSGVVFHFILFYPTAKIYLFFIPFGIPGWLFGLIYLALSLYFAKKNLDNIGHMAHFWGSLWGVIFPFLFIDKILIIDNFLSSIFNL